MYPDAISVFEYYRQVGLVPNNNVITVAYSSNSYHGRIWAIIFGVNSGKTEEVEKANSIIDAFKSSMILLDSHLYRGSGIYLFDSKPSQVEKTF